MDLALVSIMRDEHPYILEWVAYHRVVGVTDLTVYDNNSKDGSTELLARLHELKVVNHVPWPASGQDSPQISAYRHYRDCRASAGSNNWALYIDADEFAVPVEHDTLVEALDDIVTLAPDAKAIAINWKTFGTSGQQKANPGLVVERFQKCAEGGRAPNNCVKSAVCLQALSDPHIHVHQIVNGRYVSELGEDVEIYGNGMSRQVSHERVQINHYMTKSVEEWQDKKARGNANLSDGHQQKYARLNDELFQRADRNESVCERILRFLPAIKTEIERLEQRLEALQSTS